VRTPRGVQGQPQRPQAAGVHPEEPAQEAQVSDIEIRYSVTVRIPEHDLDLMDDDLLTKALQERMASVIPHYSPTVERVTKDWEIESQKRHNRRVYPHLVLTTTKEN
jgi:hypothetical protein